MQDSQRGVRRREKTEHKKERYRTYISLDKYRAIKKIAKKNNVSMSMILSKLINEIIEEEKNNVSRFSRGWTTYRNKKSDKEIKRFYVYLTSEELQGLKETSERLKYSMSFLVARKIEKFIEEGSYNEI